MIGQACLPAFAQEEEILEKEKSFSNEVVEEVKEEKVDTENEFDFDMSTITVQYRDWSSDRIIKSKVMDVEIVHDADDVFNFDWSVYLPEGYDAFLQCSRPEPNDNGGYITSVYCGKIGDKKEVEVNWNEYEVELPNTIEMEIKESYIIDGMDFYSIYREEVGQNITQVYLWIKKNLKNNFEKETLVSFLHFEHSF